MIRVDKNGRRVNMVSHITIYMDDILIFCRRKKDAYAVYQMLEYQINLKFLELHKTRIEKFRKNMFLDVIGYRFYRDRVTIRRIVYLRIKRLAAKAKRYKVTSKMSQFMAYQIISYNGCIVNSDSSKIVYKIDFNELLDIATDIISDCNSIFPPFS